MDVLLIDEDERRSWGNPGCRGQACNPVFLISPTEPPLDLAIDVIIQEHIHQAVEKRKIENAYLVLKILRGVKSSVCGPKSLSTYPHTRKPVLSRKVLS